jgi:hypothetical protein
MRRKLTALMGTGSAIHGSKDLFMILLHSPVQSVADAVVGIFDADPHMQLVFVMIITPCCMNAFQFWITDNFLKEAPTDDNFSDEEMIPSSLS